MSAQPGEASRNAWASQSTPGPGLVAKAAHALALEQHPGNNWGVLVGSDGWAALPAPWWFAVLRRGKMGWIGLHVSASSWHLWWLVLIVSLGLSVAYLQGIKAAGGLMQQSALCSSVSLLLSPWHAYGVTV